jgi:hypothetical protein
MKIIGRIYSAIWWVLYFKTLFDLHDPDESFKIEGFFAQPVTDVSRQPP